MLTAVLCLSFAFAACDDSAKEDPKPPITNNQDEQSGNQGQQGNQGEQGGEQNEQGGNSGNETPKPDEEKDEPHTHHFEDYVYNNNATCTRDGTETAFCSCGEIDIRIKVGTALGHDMQPVEAKEPTCTEIGWDTYQKCTRCDEKQNYTEREALGHDFQDDFCTRCQKQEPRLSYALTPDAESYMVVGRGTCKDTDIVIPSVYNGKPVTEIAEEAFKGKTDITSVKIPDSIVTIGVNAFSECFRLENVLFGDNSQLTSIGAGAFSGAIDRCSALTEITIPSSVIVIGERAFMNREGLTKITIPAGVTSIGEYAFMGCIGLEKIEVEKGNTFYEGKQNCLIEISTKTLILGCKMSKIPDDGSVTSIGNYAFYGCKSLMEIKIPAGVISIGYAAFAGCSSFTEITIPAGVTSIGEYAFESCSSLTEITIPASVNSIGRRAFQRCSRLQSVIFESDSSLNSIGDSAFYGCISLTKITIPAGVTSIGAEAFEGCSSLQSVTFLDPNGWSCNGTQFSETLLKDSATAAVYLVKTYSSHVWSKNSK